MASANTLVCVSSRYHMEWTWWRTRLLFDEVRLELDLFPFLPACGGVSMLDDQQYLNHYM